MHSLQINSFFYRLLKHKSVYRLFSLRVFHAVQNFFCCSKLTVRFFFVFTVLFNITGLQADMVCTKGGVGFVETTDSISEMFRSNCLGEMQPGCTGSFGGIYLLSPITGGIAVPSGHAYCLSHCPDGTFGGAPTFDFFVSCTTTGNTYFADLNDINDDGNTSGSQNTSSCNPINLITGNKYKIHTDITSIIEGSSIHKPEFTRIYNSSATINKKRQSDLNLYNNGWSNNYQKKIEFIRPARSAVNYIGRTDAPGNIDVSLQSIKYASRQLACEKGVREVVANTTSPFSPRVLSGTPVYKNNQCYLVDEYGRFITKIPIKSNVTVGLSNNVSIPFELNIFRPDGNVLVFSLGETTGGTTPTKYTYNAITLGLNTQVIRNIADINSGNTGSLFDKTLSYVYTDENDIVETYNRSGVLQTITYPNGIIETLQYDATTGLLNQVVNNFGHSLQFAYNPSNQIESVTEAPSNRVWLYAYNTEGLLEKVINPDLTEKNYQYTSTPQGTLLAGLIDERNIRYSTFDYYDNGLAKSSYLGDSLSKIDNTSVQYATGTNTVTDSRGNQTTLQISTSAVKGLVTQIDSGVCSTCASKDVTYNYDTNAFDPFQSKLNVLDKTEFNILTNYNSYDANGNPTSITEAVNTPEGKLTTYTYDPRFERKLSSITEPSVSTDNSNNSNNSKVTSYTYDAYANITDVTVSGFTPEGTPVTRSNTLKYNGPFNQISEYDGPRSDVNDIIFFDYYANDAAEGNNRARLKSVRTFDNIYYQNNITYTATGKIAGEERANNLVITYSYYPGNDRLSLMVQVDSVSGAMRMTGWAYLPTGEVRSITQGVFSPNPIALTLDYDDARRLTKITDALGNYIEYVLDSEGNVESENIYDASGALTKALTQTFDTYNRLETATQVNENQTLNFNPDGTIGSVTDGKSVVSQYSYDSLKRLTNITQDQDGINPATADALTQLGYDVQNNLTTVTDANNAQTVYVYDDLGNLLSQTSPDTGSVNYSHDAAGNITQSTDAKGQVFNYTYDSLNRLTNITAPVAEDNVSYVYDSCPQGVGQLCQSVRNNSSLSYRYTSFGEVAGVDQSLVTWDGYNQANNTLNYAYDATGRLNQITYPSGAIVNYSYNAAGKIDNVNLDQNGVVSSLSLNIAYVPFGAETIQTYGNTLEIFNYFDEAYRSIITGEPLLYYDYQVSYDANGNTQNSMSLTGNGQVISQGYNYDEHQRLTESNGFSGNYAYAYDTVGNRTNKTQDTIETSSAYQPNTNRLSSLAGETIVTDANGNITNLRAMALTFTSDNRLKSVGTASFEYNGNGERSIKHSQVTSGLAASSGVSQGTSYIYGLNGELIAEIGATGMVTKEYIYLNGKPLSMLVHQPSSNELFLNADIDGDGEISVEDYLVWFLNHRTDPAFEVTGDGVSDAQDSTLVLNCAIAQGSCVASSYSTDIYYIHNDHLGTPKMLTNSNAQPVWRASASPFGDATVNDDVDGDGVAVEFNIRQPGQYYDVESGFYYNYFRYYDPGTGRYVTSDPIGLAGGINTYAYALNSPLRYIDKDGRIVIPVLSGLIGGAYSGYKSYRRTDSFYEASVEFGLGFASGVFKPGLTAGLVGITVELFKQRRQQEASCGADGLSINGVVTAGVLNTSGVSGSITNSRFNRINSKNPYGFVINEILSNIVGDVLTSILPK